ncbi:MAG: redox-sensitive transcriptional activator SoxR [Parvularculaceae bacterium]
MRKQPPKPLTPRETASRAGLSVSALHFYERQGLIKAWRTDGNQRRYDRAALRRLGVIKAAQALGLPLSEIKARLAPLPHDRAPTQAGWARVARRWRADLDQRIVRLERLRDCLDGCIGCGCLSVKACPLRNPEDAMGLEGSGARWIERDD